MKVVGFTSDDGYSEVIVSVSRADLRELAGVESLPRLRIGTTIDTRGAQRTGRLLAWNSREAERHAAQLEGFAKELRSYDPGATFIDPDPETKL